MTLTEEEVDRSPCISTIKVSRGWIAAHMYWNPLGYWEVFATGENAYSTQEEAREDAKNWAINDEMRYVE